MSWLYLLDSFILLMAVPAHAEPRVDIDISSVKAQINPAMWGTFLEDINFAADGGLYAELVKNRSFEFPNATAGWTKVQKQRARGVISIRDTDPFEPKNPHYMRIEVSLAGEGFGIANEGFRGMGIREGQKYWFSVYARAPMGSISFRVEIVSQDGRVIAQAKVSGVDSQWKNYTCTIVPTQTCPKAKLNLLTTEKGLLDVDMVSLFPSDGTLSFEGRPIPRLRQDLVQMLAELKPGFFRFPGGCIVEGRDLDNRYQWKNTIGDINKRKLIISRWNNEFAHRYTPDYYQSFGLGFYEYFLLSEKLNAEPMPIINCGMACQFNTGQLVPMDELGPYVQDALDLIEFANGSVDSKWGKIRAELGHPEPFNLKMLGIGNEQWGSQYIERYKVFVKAIKEKYPDIKLIAATGSDPAIFPNGYKEVEYLWSELRKLNAEIVDEHFYRPPEWFFENAYRYDDYDHNGPKIFIGEFATQSKGIARPDNRNNWYCSLAEAAFMIGLERNADLVIMACYAPLFAHIDAWQWTPDLIWFDNLKTYGTPNYYVQQLFSLNRGDKLLDVQTRQIPEPEGKKPLYMSACLDQKASEVIIKAVNSTGKNQLVTINLKSTQLSGKDVVAIVLSADSITAENSFEQPKKVYPKQVQFSVADESFEYNFEPYSLTVLRIPVSR
jgi:alpha-N-arabinofuranosidase